MSEGKGEAQCLHGMKGQGCQGWFAHLYGSNANTWGLQGRLVHCCLGYS